MDTVNNFQIKPLIMVAGVGGGGGNAINRMIENNVSGVTYVAINTDSQDLKRSLAEIRILIGEGPDKGLGAGQNASRGQEAATESEDAIRQALKPAKMVFVTCGMGGGTGTGAAPIVARVAKEEGALVVGVVTKPYTLEGKRRRENALRGIAELKPNCDALIVIENDKLNEISDHHTTLLEAFREADNVLRQCVQGISDLIMYPGVINVDFADIKTVLKDKGTAIMGIGVASGENKAIKAARAAISSKILETSIQGATDAILNITAPTELSQFELSEVLQEIRNNTSTDINIIMGVMINDKLVDEIIVTVIATGVELTKSHTDAESFANELVKNTETAFFNQEIKKIQDQAQDDFFASFNQDTDNSQDAESDENSDIPFWARK